LGRSYGCGWIAASAAERTAEDRAFLQQNFPHGIHIDRTKRLMHP